MPSARPSSSRPGAVLHPRHVLLPGALGTRNATLNLTDAIGAGDDHRALRHRGHRLLPGERHRRGRLRRGRRRSTATLSSVHLNHPIVGMAADRRRRRLLARGVRRGHLQLRRRPVLRLHRGASTSTSRSSAWRSSNANGPRLLARGVRRGHLQLRRRPVLRLHRKHPPQQADRRHGRRPPTAAATGWWRPTGASSATATPRSTARPERIHLNKPIVGMAATPDGGGLLAGGLRRRHLQPTATPQFYGSTGALPLVATHCRHGRHARRRRATGSPPPTAGCSTTATPPSTAAGRRSVSAGSSA